MGFASIARACLPDALRRLRWKYYCPVCETKVPHFSALPAFLSEQLVKHGADLMPEDAETCNAASYSCPGCGAADRERLYALYLGRRIGASPPGNFRLLEIAPAPTLSRHIRRRFRIAYRTADLSMPEVDDHIDMARMDCYPDASFDAFICSHVLEHVPDDRAAMSELYRILKSGGWGIAMVPISLSLPEIREDPAATSEAQRWARFGQGDHVRVYNRAGFLARLRGAGFRTSELGAGFFGAALFERCGIAPRSVLYVVEK